MDTSVLLNRYIEEVGAADRSHWEIVDLTAEVLDRAEQVIQRAGVRTLDAVHLASALEVQAASGRRRRAEFITADARQRDAAVGLGLRVTWVG
jgi:predicted nucleic acid-binding protein